MNLHSDDPSERSAAVEGLLNEQITRETAKFLCSLVEDPDKGVRNAADRVLSSNPSPDIPGFLIKYISSEEIDTRNLAGEILLKIGSNSLPAMLEYLKSENDDDIKFIIDLLGLIGDLKAAPAILEVLQKNRNDNVIIACIEALGNLKYGEALDTIISFYYQNELYKATIFESIGKIGSPEALDFITSNYHSEDDLTKFSMIESLGLIGNEDSLFFLLSELTELSGPLIWPIMESIFLLKEKFNLDVPFDERMKNIILNTIDEADAKYKKTAAKLITAYDTREIMLACLKIYGEDPETDEILKAKIQEAPEVFFEHISGFISVESRNLKELLELTEELFTYDFTSFRESVSPIHLREFADSCAECLDNPDEEIRRLGMEILFTIDSSIAILFMDKMLADNSIWNKLKLLEILSEIDTPESVDAIKELAKDPDEMVKERAAFMLEQEAGIQQETNPEENL